MAHSPHLVFVRFRTGSEPAEAAVQLLFVGPLRVGTVDHDHSRFVVAVLALGHAALASALTAGLLVLGLYTNVHGHSAFRLETTDECTVASPRIRGCSSGAIGPFATDNGQRDLVAIDKGLSAVTASKPRWKLSSSRFSQPRLR